jgi:oxalate decarboxylase/phosphoglucose isomerase-like protein (cupin superfamily)
MPCCQGSASSPRTIAVVNDYDVRVVKVGGEFSRHSHPETDEFFLVLSGALTIRMDRGDVHLRAAPLGPRRTTPVVAIGSRTFRIF